jgi:hypothetical protein
MSKAYECGNLFENLPQKIYYDRLETQNTIFGDHQHELKMYATLEKLVPDVSVNNAIINDVCDVVSDVAEDAYKTGFIDAINLLKSIRAV